MEEEKDLHEQYVEKSIALRTKYTDVINAIAVKYGVDVGIAFEMLKAIGRGNQEYGEGIEFNVDELRQEYNELLVLSEEIAKDRGLI